MPAPLILRRSVSPGTPEDRRAAVAGLDQVKVDILTLHCGVQRAHCNVRGDKAYGLHHLLEKFACCLCEQGDKVGEMVEALGGESSGSVEELAARTRLRPWPKGVVNGPEVGAVVVDRSSALLAFMAADIAAFEAQGQAGHAHALRHVSGHIEHMAWLVDAGMPTSEEVAEAVYRGLLEDFPPAAIAWVRSDPMGTAAPPKAG